MPTSQVTRPAGEIIYTKITGHSRRKAPGEKRAARQKPTIPSVQKYNEKLAVIELMLKIAHNFMTGDHFLLLTYDNGYMPTPEQAKTYLENFYIAARAKYKEYGKVFKRITVTEYESTNIHHHLIVNADIPFEEIAKLWPHGIVGTRSLRKMGGYKGLAEYIIKETSKTFRNPDAVNKRRYTCSRSVLKVPEAKRKEVSGRLLYEEPKPEKGYYIIPESIHRGKNPITEVPYLEYLMVSLEEQPRVKKYLRGKKHRPREAQATRKWLRDHEERQMEIQIDEKSVC